MLFPQDRNDVRKDPGAFLLAAPYCQLAALPIPDTGELLVQVGQTAEDY